jgi:hypothetical protein
LGFYRHRYGWYGIDLNKSYQARFYGIPMILLVTKKEIKIFFEQSFRLPVFDLSNPVLENFLAISEKNLITLTVILVQSFCSKFYKTKALF